MALLISFLLAGPLFLLYAGFPLYNLFVQGVSERFYLLPIVIYLLFLPFGFLAIKLLCEKVFSKKIYASLILCVFFIIPILLFKANFPKTDFSKTRLGTQLAKDYLQNLPRNSLIIVQGDTKAFNIWYVHFVLKYRPDVEVVQFGNYSLKNQYFDTITQVVIRKYNPSQGELFEKTLEEISQNKQVFSTDSLLLTNKKYSWLPYGLSVQLIKETDFPDEDVFRQIVRHNFGKMKIPNRSDLTLPERSLTISDIPSYYAEAFYKIGSTYFDRYNDIAAATLYFQDTLVIDPTYSRGYVGSARIKAENGECSAAEDDIKHAISIFPSDESSYLLWYAIALKCPSSSSEISEINSAFEKISNQKISERFNKVMMSK